MINVFRLLKHIALHFSVAGMDTCYNTECVCCLMKLAFKKTEDKTLHAARGINKLTCTIWYINVTFSIYTSFFYFLLYKQKHVTVDSKCNKINRLKGINKESPSLSRRLK